MMLRAGFAAIRVRVGNEADMGEFLRFVRARHFLAQKRSKTLVHVVPLVSLSEQTDRGRVARLVSEWEAQNAGRRAEVLSD
jgi:hypothetical protein